MKPLAFWQSGVAVPSPYWESDTNATGSPCSAWGDVGSNTRSLAQATAGNRPAVTAAVFGSTQGLTFDGSNDCLSYATTGFLADNSAGSLSLVFKTGSSVVGPFVLLSNTNAAVSNDSWEIGIGADGKIYITNNASGTSWTIQGSTVLSPSTVYQVLLTYDGTDYHLRVNNVEENPLVMTSGTFVGAWLGRAGATDTLTVGALVLSSGTTRFFNGVIGGIYLWTSDISS